MKKKVRQVAWGIYFKLFSMYGRWILKCRTKHVGAVFFKAYIETFSMFPDFKLKYNSEIASSVRWRLFGISPSEDLSNVDGGHVDALYDVVKSDEWVQKTIPNYFLLESFYYSYGVSAHLTKQKADNALKRAMDYDETVSPFSYNDVPPINKKIKTDIKALKREIRRLNSERVETEKLKIIEPITINTTHVMFLASLFSTLFLVSGFAYNKIFFASFGINVADFFAVSDYIASSVDILTATIVSSFIGLIFFFWGVSSALSEELHAEQFETDIKGRDYVVALIVINSSILLPVYSYRFGELLSPLLFLLVFFIVSQVFYRLPIWKYIENKAAVGAVLMSVICFSLYLGVKIKDNIAKIEKGDYKGPYAVKLKKEYREYSGNEYIAGNSNYMFLWDSGDGKIIVIPKGGVESLCVK